MKFLLAFSIAGLLAGTLSAAIGYETDVYCGSRESAILGILLFAPVSGAVACTVGWYLGRPSRSRFRRAAVPTIVLTLLAGSLGWWAPESKFLLDPEVDTVVAAGLSKEHFAAVQPGMTKAEVTSLLGEPAEVITLRHGVVWLFSHDSDRGFDRAWRRYQIELSPSGVVTSRGTGWSCD